MEIFVPIIIAALVGLLLTLPHALASGNEHYEEPKDE
jgi:hypothetical protein